MWEFLFGFALGVYFWRCRWSSTDMGNLLDSWWDGHVDAGDMYVHIWYIRRCWTHPRTRPVSPGLQKNVNMPKFWVIIFLNIVKIYFSPLGTFQTAVWNQRCCCHTRRNLSSIITCSHPAVKRSSLTFKDKQVVAVLVNLIYTTACLGLTVFLKYFSELYFIKQLTGASLPWWDWAKSKVHPPQPSHQWGLGDQSNPSINKSINQSINQSIN